MLDHTGQEGGAEIALLRLAEELGDRFAIRAIILSPGPFVDRLRHAGIETVVLPLDAAVAGAAREDVLASPLRSARAAARVLTFLPRLIRAIRGSGAELVVANTLKSAVIAAVAAPLAGRPWVWHLHDRLSPDYLPTRVAEIMIALADVGPRRIVANSSATMRTLSSRAAAKTTIAYPGLPRSAFFDGARPPDEPVFGILGRLGHTKGQHEFLQAAALLAHRRDDVTFRVIGRALFNDAGYETELRALPASLGIGDRVEFTGWTSDPTTELRRLTALVHASPVPEPFGQVLVEAMAVGVPVIAADAGGATEIVAPDAAPSGLTLRRTPWGQLTRPGDVRALAEAMEWSLEHAAQAAVMAGEARDVVADRFSIEETGRVVARIWDEGMAGRRSRR